MRPFANVCEKSRTYSVIRKWSQIIKQFSNHQFLIILDFLGLRMESETKNIKQDSVEREKMINSIDPQITDKTKNDIKRSVYGISFALLTAFCSGMVSITVKGANFFSGTDITFIRYIISFIFMIIMGRFGKTNIFGFKEIRKDLILIGLFYSTFVLLLYISYKLVEPSEGITLSRCNIFIIPIIGRFYLKEKFRILYFLSLFMAIFGVVFIAQPSFLFYSEQNSIFKNFTNSSIITLKKDNGLQRIFGITAALLSALSSSFGQTLSKKIADKMVHFSVPILYHSFFGIPFSLLTSLIFFLTGAHKYNFQLVKDFQSIFFQVSFLLIACIFGISFQIFLYLALKYENSSVVAIIVSTAILFTLIAQYFILNIIPNILSIFGVLLIFSSDLILIFFEIFEKVLLRKKNDNQDSEGENTKVNSGWKRCLFLKI